MTRLKLLKQRQAARKEQLSKRREARRELCRAAVDWSRCQDAYNEVQTRGDREERADLKDELDDLLKKLTEAAEMYEDTVGASEKR